MSDNWLELVENEVLKEILKLQSWYNRPLFDTFLKFIRCQKGGNTISRNDIDYAYSIFQPIPMAIYSQYQQTNTDYYTVTTTSSNTFTTTDDAYVWRV